MKTAKKLASLLLALVMVLSLATTAFAATVTVPENSIISGHSFVAYQIFMGDYSGTNVLSNVVWGDGIDSTRFLAALKADTTLGYDFADCVTAADVAEVLATFGDESDKANKVAKLAEDNKVGTGTELSDTTELADGYYLIVDTADISDETGAAKNAALLQVVGEINITVKTDVPTLEKKVKEDDKTVSGEGYGDKYNDVADYDIGEAVPFKLIAKVPDMTYYDTYKMVFHDTLSDGLTLDQDSIKVYVADDKAGASKTDISSSFGYAAGTNGETFTMTCNDIKVINGVTAGKYIIVEYTATLTQNAEIGLPGNTNTAYLEYSNNPDQEGTGKTEEDKVIVFTYKLDVTKVDGEDNTKKLSGAQFVLLNENKDKVAVFGTDKKVEWVNLPEAVNGKIPAGSWNQNSIKTSTEDGSFSFEGLDDGVYYLREIVAPEGYNLMATDTKVEIKATTVNDQNWGGVAGNALTAITVKVDNETVTNGNMQDGSVGISVENNAGTKLPETGGMGTTIFYVLGSILAIGAVVLLVTKKRMSANA